MDLQRSQAASKSQTAKFTMRTTSSNSIVVSKTDRAASLPNAKARKSVKPATVSEIESDEDDSLERDVALSSPVKGEEYRNSIQVCISLSPLIYAAWPLDIGEGPSHPKAEGRGWPSSPGCYSEQRVDASSYSNVY